MPNPTFAKTWDFAGLNQRISYVSLLDTSARLLYGIKNYLVGTMGAAVVFTSDGATGPATQVDATDRWTGFAECDTRGTTPQAAKSFAVIAWGGGQLLLDFTGASDDIFRVAFSQGSLYRANTATGSFTFTINVATDICTAVAHGQVTGAGPFVATGSTPGQILLNTPYWIHRLTDDTFYICTSYANAIAGNAIDLQATGTPPLTLTAFPATSTPQASDEVVIIQAVSIVNATASLDRVFAIQATTDRSIFRMWCHRADTLISSFGLERVVEGHNVPVGMLFGWNSAAVTTNAYTLNTAGHHGGAFNPTLGGVATCGVYAFGAVRVCDGGTVTFDGVVNAAAGATITPLNGVAIIWPLFVAHTVGASAGFIGTRIDAFFHHSTLGGLFAGTSIDDIAAGTRLMWCGTMLTPWSTSVGLVRT